MDIIKFIYKKVYFLFFNIINKTNIKSSDVSPKAEIGYGVNISKLTAIDSDCQIAKYTSIGKNTNITKSIIGNYSSIANNVSIGQGEHDLNKISTKAMFYDNSKGETLTPNECIIGHDVWIGAHAIILRDVKIGNGAVIGAGAVVTKDVNDFEIVVGVPARKIKERFSDEKQKRIKNSKWWDKNPEEAKELFKELVS